MFPDQLLIVYGVLDLRSRLSCDTPFNRNKELKCS